MRTSSLYSHLQLLVGIAVAAWGSAAVSTPTASQVVRGQVRRADTDETVQRARIELMNRAGNTTGATTSDEVGEFLIATREQGKWWLRVRRQGFATARHGPITLLAKDTVVIVVLLEPEVVLLDTVVVETDVGFEYLRDVGFYQREQLRLGRRVGPEAVERRRVIARYVADYAVSLPGVVIVERPEAGFGRQIGMKNCRVLNYYVDDRHVSRNGGPPDPAETGMGILRDRLEDWVDPQDVLAIELYTRSSKRPPEYSACSVVVWTRYGAMVHAKRSPTSP